mmetsp:Transcript_40322/g.79514  ORF Transcript_40322/g.79514 Transcript_40322/m.79514 type:complete len:136 (-) Transcript_40322:831-1238(-)
MHACMSHFLLCFPSSSFDPPYDCMAHCDGSVGWRVPFRLASLCLTFPLRPRLSGKDLADMLVGRSKDGMRDSLGVCGVLRLILPSFLDCICFLSFGSNRGWMQTGSMDGMAGCRLIKREREGREPRSIDSHIMSA